MIKIRYRDAVELSPGLHAAAVRQGRTTIVFLLPGLTAAQRRSALRRLRLSARMGYCPPLPPAQLALALAADRIRTTVGQLGTLVRSHPAGSTVPVMVISAGAIAFLALSAVSIQVLRLPPDSGRSSSLPGTAGESATGIPTPSPLPDSPTTGSPGPVGANVAPVFSTSPAAGWSPRPFPTTRIGWAPTPGASATPTIPAWAAPSPSSPPIPSAAAGPAPAASASPGPAMQVPPGSTPSPTATPTPTPTTTATPSST
jgi:hypothetical protein